MSDNNQTEKIILLNNMIRVFKNEEQLIKLKIESIP